MVTSQAMGIVIQVSGGTTSRILQKIFPRILTLAIQEIFNNCITTYLRTNSLVDPFLKINNKQMEYLKTPSFEAIEHKENNYLFYFFIKLVYTYTVI